MLINEESRTKFHHEFFHFLHLFFSVFLFFLYCFSFLFIILSLSLNELGALWPYSADSLPSSAETCMQDKNVW